MTKICCPECKGTDITDHSEFGLPTGCDMWCHSCDHLWIASHYDEPVHWIEVVDIIIVGLIVFFIYQVGGF